MSISECSSSSDWADWRGQRNGNGDSNSKRVVVVGGGVAGIQCCQELGRYIPLHDTTEIVLLTASPRLSYVQFAEQISMRIARYEVVDSEINAHNHIFKRLKLVIGTSTRLLAQKNTIVYTNPQGQELELRYSHLCIATGACPRSVKCEVDPGALSTILTIRDEISVFRFIDRLKNISSRRPSVTEIIVVGNGGVALELVSAMVSQQDSSSSFWRAKITWLIKENYIGDAFFQKDAADLLLNVIMEHLQRKNEPQDSHTTSALNNTSSIPESETNIYSGGAPVDGTGDAAGGAVGPNWRDVFEKASSDATKNSFHLTVGNGNISLDIVYNSRMSRISREKNSATDSNYTLVHLSNGQTYRADIVVNATGVDPNTQWLEKCGEVHLHEEDRGIVVDSLMQVKTVPGISNVFSAGDCCHVELKQHESQFWFQMRLWTQAIQMGRIAAHSIIQSLGYKEKDDMEEPDMFFELFTHSTRFCGLQVALLGLYNGQKIDENSAKNLVTYSRVNYYEKMYTRVVLLDGRMQGAVIIGDPSIAEIYENLILDQLDVSALGEHIVDSDKVDLHAYFD